MRLLVTGGTGTLGPELVRAATAAGHDAIAMSRKPAPAETEGAWATANLVTGEGLEAAVRGVDAIVHAASDSRGDPAVDEEGTRRLAAVARSAGVRHLAFVSIVGIDRIPFPYYARKLAAERALAESRMPYSILRATQFHSLVDRLFTRAARALPLVMPLPAGYHVQSVAIEDVASRLLRALDEGPRGLLPDYGGPEPMTARHAATLWKRARGVGKPIVSFPQFTATSAAFRAGHNILPAAAAPDQRGMISWTDWLLRSPQRPGGPA